MKLDEAVAVLSAIGLVGAERAVVGHAIDLPLRIGGWPLTRHADAALCGVRRRAVEGYLFERLIIVGEDPTVKRGLISVRAECNIDNAIRQQQSRALEMPERI